jgi:chitin disaccharide deacetylase
MRRTIIFNADDFGLSTAVNEGILRSFREGVVRSVSIMAPGKAFADAIRRLRENPSLDCGVHLVVSEEVPLSSGTSIPSIMKRGRMRKTEDFLAAFACGRIDLDEAAAECEAQIRRVLAEGVKISHLDSHFHLHLLPGMTEKVIGLAQKFAIPCVRCTSDPFRAPWKREGRRIAMNAASFFARGKLRQAGLRITDCCYGFSWSGHLSAARIRTVLAAGLPFGAAEFLCHPGSNGEGNEEYRWWEYEWERELQALTDPSIKEAAREEGVDIVNFRELL